MNRLGRMTILLLIAAMNGCDDTSVRVYDLPKHSDAASAGPHGPAPEGANHPSRLVFEPAPGWVETAPSSGMVRRQYAAGPVKITHSAFPGDVGGDLANINRWRGQLGLGPIEAGQAKEAVVPRPAGDLVIRRVDLAHSGRRMVIDMIRAGAMTWFLKMDGPADAVVKELARFNRHAESARPEAAAPSPSPGEEAQE